MKSEFERYTLSKLVDIDQKSLGKKTPEDFTFSYISLSDVSSGNISKTLEKHSFKSAPSRARRVLQNGDIIMATVRPNLQGFAKITEEFSHCVASTGFAVLSPKDNVSGEFIYQCLYSYQITKQIESLVVGSNYPAINSSDVAGLHIYTPPYPEQRKIAKILSTWDNAISTTERLIDNSKQQKKALMQQLLTGKKRLLDDSGKPFEEKWEYRSIGEISTRIQRKSDEEIHPILTISSLSGFVTQEERYSRYMAGESVKKYILLKEGEFAYNKGNSKTYQFGCIFDLEGFKTGLVPHVYVCFKLNSDLSHRYFKYLFEADYLKPQLGALVNTGVRNNGLLNIKPSAFLNTKVPVPSVIEQEKIANVFHAATENLKHLEHQLAHLKQEKKALMQQLLSGKRRVKVDDEALA